MCGQPNAARETDFVSFVIGASLWHYLYSESTIEMDGGAPVSEWGLGKLFIHSPWLTEWLNECMNEWNSLDMHAFPSYPHWFPVWGPAVCQALCKMGEAFCWLWLEHRRIHMQTNHNERKFKLLRREGNSWGIGKGRCRVWRRTEFGVEQFCSACLLSALVSLTSGEGGVVFWKDALC